MKHKCPVCQKIVATPSQGQIKTAEPFPFCSRRCKLIDLGAWLDGEYKLISDLPSKQPEDSSIHSSETNTDK